MNKLIKVLACSFITVTASVNAQDIVLKGKELFGNLEAREIGPALMSGRIIDLENHPTNSKIIYAGSAGGGVWKSENAGASFVPIFDDYAHASEI